jgi:hypothetical protein
VTALHRMDPQRTVFHRSPSPIHAEHWEPAGGIIRMTKEAE